jgi:hypothetical protein
MSLRIFHLIEIDELRKGIRFRDMFPSNVGRAGHFLRFAGILQALHEDVWNAAVCRRLARQSLRK